MKWRFLFAPLLCLLPSLVAAQTPNTFVPTGSMSAARFEHTATLLANGKVLVVGGSGPAAWLSSTEVYDPVLASFAPGPSMTTARGRHTATLLADGRILVAGGANSTGNLMSAELFDPGSGNFTPAPNMVTDRSGHTATLLQNGKVLLVGGFENVSGVTQSAEIYDPTTGTFSAAGSMVIPRAWHTAALLPDGRVLITGGFHVVGGSGVTEASAEVYDPTTGTFTLLANSMTTPRELQTATLLPDRRVLIAGGLELQGGYGVYKMTAEIFDPTTGAFVATGSMTISRAIHTATLLSNGQVLLAGGDTACGPQLGCAVATLTAELYDSVAGSFSPTGSMVTARDRHTATLLPSGNVLVTGGSDGTTFLQSAEIYAPSGGIVVTHTLTAASTNPGSGVGITASPSDNNGKGNGTTPFSLTYNDGAVVTLTALTTASGNNFSNWTGCDSAPSTTCTVTMNGDRTVTANYVTLLPVTRTLTVASTNPSSGAAITVSPSDNNSLGNGNTQFIRTYNNATVVTLGAQAIVGGNNFSSWTGCDLTLNTTCTVTMNNDRTVTANYLTPPSIISVSPTFGIQGQTITNFTVIGNNFQPNSTVSFSGGPSDFTVSYGSRTATQIVASVTIANNAAISLRDVSVTNPDSQSATLKSGFRIAREVRISFDGLIDIGADFNEPSIAVDPHDSQHAVVGYNATGSFGLTQQCAWAQSRDGGAHWTSGSLSFPSGFHGISDPWLRYSPNGQLFYSCIGVTNWNVLGLVHIRTVGAFVTASGTGLANDFNQAVPVATVPQVCFGLLITCEEQGGFTDHPSIGVLQKVDGSIGLVACWVENFPPNNRSYLRAAYSSDGGQTWPTKKVLAANVGPCAVGEGNQEISISYWNFADQSLKLLLSTDGVNWPQQMTAVKLVPDVSQLLPNSKGSLESTTNLALSEPYALGIPSDACPPGQNCLRAVWQTRTDSKSRVFIADSPSTSNGILSGVALPKPKADEGSAQADPERFLPGAGSCTNLVGAYETVDDSGNFRYKVWSLIGPAVTNSLDAKLIFRSGQDMSSVGAPIDPKHPGFGRIGDYTSVDCSQNLAWAVWTDRRSTAISSNLTRVHVNEIWGAVIPLK